MAFENLNPFYATWRRLGLNYLLLQNDAPPGLGLCGAGQVRKTAASHSPGPPSAHSGQLNARRKYAASAKPETTAAKVSVKAETGRFKPLPPENWPENWRNELSLSRPGLFAWTYWNLGLDLAESRKKPAGGDDAESAGRAVRSGFLRRIIRELGHPAGTHTFWPASLPDGENSLAANRTVFWSGVYALKSRGVVIMGSAAAKALLNEEKIQPLTQLRQNGQFVWILWEPDVMAQRPNTFNMVLTFLRQSLRQFVRPA